jgi:hypothetical protein
MFFDEDDVFAVFRDLVTALYKLHDSLKLVLDILPAIAENNKVCSAHAAIRVSRLKAEQPI